ncbi:hypothetical protein AVEN_226862-1 [Araneus ventricosus]|uniref:Uncharacterized protein n=1 Tax=Araneus ventricosus TaxID=182803 RepID=A0A4Y2H7G0_ARAVE|nr:hypothetical protein AVEN_226862-1 [Araneus ventricosus]
MSKHTVNLQWIRDPKSQSLYLEAETSPVVLFGPLNTYQFSVMEPAVSNRQPAENRLPSSVKKTIQFFSLPPPSPSAHGEKQSTLQ